MFTPNKADLQYIFESAGETVLVNDNELKAIITNPTISEFEERYIHSIERVLQGDMVTLDSEKYLVITESISKRGEKYKALIRHCNFEIEIKNYTKELVGYNDFDQPIYKDVYTHSDFIPSIIDNKSFSIDSSSAVRVPDNQIIVIVQDNTLNEGKFAVNNKFSSIGKSWKVINHDKAKKGLLILTCEIVV